MRSEYLGMRLNQKKHKDIIAWLNKFEDRSEEARRLMLLGIRISSGEYTPAPKSSAPLVWSEFPQETISKPAKKPDYMQNILQSFE